MNPHGSPIPEAQEVMDEEWRHQERLLSALRSGVDGPAGDAGGERYRDVFAALDGESLPALPDDFAARVAADAQRLVEARAQVLRFKTMMMGLLGLLYLPAMIAAALLYLPRWQGTSLGGHALPLWLVAITVLWLCVRAVETLSRKMDGESSG